MKYTALIVMLSLLLVSLVASYAQDEGYAPHPAYQRVQIPLPMRGLNTSLTGDIPADQASYLHSFIVGNNELSWPDCYRTPYSYASDLNQDRVNFLSGFRPAGGALQLVFQSGGHLYLIDVEDDSITTADRVVDTAYTSYSVSAATGTVSGVHADSYWVALDTVGRWKSIFADGSGLVMHIDSADQGNWVSYNVDYFMDDSIVFLTTPLTYIPANDTFYFSGNLGDIVFGQTFVDSFWMLTKTGEYVYGNHLTDITQDTSYYKFNEVYHGRYNFGGQILVRWFIPVSGDGGGGTAIKLSGDVAAGGRWYLFVDRCNLGDNTATIDSFQAVPFWTMFPIRTTTNAGRRIETYSSAVLADLDSAVVLSCHKLQPDHTTYTTLNVDVIFDTAYTWSEQPVTYIKLYNDTIGDLDFRSGDWFVAPGDTVIDTGTVWRMNVFGRDGDSDTAYAAPGVFSTSHADTQVTFYRRVKRLRDVGGYNCGTFWRNRLVSVHDTTSSQIDFSVAYYPESTSTYFVQVNPDDGEDILWMREMYGNLIIGKQSSIWKLNGIPGLDNFASLELAWSGASFVVDRSIVNYNNLLFGLARDGFYVYDFNSMVRISDDINAFVTDTMDWEYIDRSAAGFFDGHYWISFPRASSGTHLNGSVLMYNPRAQAWTTSNTLFGSVYIDHANVASDSDQVYLGSSDNANTIGISIYGRGTSSEFARWETGWLNFGSPFVEKVINRIFVVYDGQHAVSNPFYVFLYHDNSSTYDEARSFGTESVGTRKTAKFQFNGDQTRGYEHKFRFVAASSAVFHSIGQVWVEYYEESVDY